MVFLINLPAESVYGSLETSEGSIYDPITLIMEDFDLYCEQKNSKKKPNLNNFDFFLTFFFPLICGKIRPNQRSKNENFMTILCPSKFKRLPQNVSETLKDDRYRIFLVFIHRSETIKFSTKFSIL